MSTGGAKLTAATAPGGVLLRVEGPIDERFDGTAFVAAARGAVIVDLGGVDRVTSYGIREWVNALKRMECSYLGFVRCRPLVVAQLNMVKGFAGRGEVLSVFAPYRCSGCGKDIQT